MSPPSGREQTAKGNWYTWDGLCMSVIYSEAPDGLSDDEWDDWVDERLEGIPEIVRVFCGKCESELGPFVQGDIDKLVDDHCVTKGNCVLNRVHWTGQDWVSKSGFARTRGPKPVLFYWFGVGGEYGEGAIVQKALRLGSRDELASPDGLTEQQIEDWINEVAEE